MLRKWNKFYADWRENGKRKRKAFPTAKAALLYTERMRRKFAAKKVRPTRASRSSAERG
jgi:hypothetical protein